MLRHLTLLLLIFMLSVFPIRPQAAQDNPPSPDQNPIISILSPGSAPRLTLVSIAGGPFSSNPTENSVSIGGIAAPSRTISTTQIEFLVPETVPMGTLAVAVTTRGLTSGPASFIVTRPATLDVVATSNYNAEISSLAVQGLNLRTLAVQSRAAIGDDLVYPFSGALTAGRGIFPTPYFAGLNFSPAAPGVAAAATSLYATPTPGRAASGRDSLISDLSGATNPSQVYAATSSGLSSFANSFANFQPLPPGAGAVLYPPVFSPSPAFNARAAGVGNPFVQSDVFLLTSSGVADFGGGTVRLFRLPANAGDPVGPLVVRRNPQFGTVPSAGTSSNPFLDGFLLSTSRGMVEISAGAATLIAFPQQAGSPVSAPIYRGNPNFNPLIATGVSSIGDSFPIRPEILVATTNGLVSIVGSTPTFIPVPAGAGRILSAPICQLNANFNLFPGANPSLGEVALFAGPVLLVAERGIVSINDGAVNFVAFPPGASQQPIGPPITPPNPDFNAFFPTASAGSPRPFSSSIVLATSNGLITISGNVANFTAAPFEAGQVISPPTFQLNPLFNARFNPASPSGAVQPFAGGALLGTTNGLLRIDGGRTEITPLPAGAGMPIGAPIPMVLPTAVSQVLLPVSNGVALFGSGNPTLISTPAGAGKVIGPPLRTAQGQWVLSCNGGLLLIDGFSGNFSPSPNSAGEIVSTPIPDPTSGGNPSFLLTTANGFLRFSNGAFNFFPLPGNASQHISSKLTLTATAAAQTPPVANAGPNRSANEGDNLTFDGSGSSAQGGAIVSYQWDFGDGAMALGQIVNHVFADNGAYTVRLTVTDSSGLIGVGTSTVVVLNVPPSVNAGGDRTVGAGDNVAFQGSFSDPGTRDTFTIRWDFGDGGFTLGTLTPTHLYPTVGVFTVTLTVTDKDGASGVNSARVTVTDTVAPQVNLVSPSGGETLQPGSAFTIRWNSFDNVGVVAHEVRLSTDGGASFATRLDSGLSGFAQSFDWLVPINLTASNARIQVTARDAAGNAGAGLSGFFTVRDNLAPQVTVSAPSTGQVISAGSSFTIRWLSSDNVAVVSHTILLSTDGGLNFGTVIASNRFGAETSFDWFVPGSLFTSNARIRVVASDAAGNTGSGDSGNFSVRDTSPPTVSLQAPSGGETISPANNFLIRWIASDNVGVASIDLLLSTDGGFSFPTVIISGLPGSQNSFNWQVPNTLSTSLGRVRIIARDAAGNQNQGESGNFTIRDTIPPTVSISSPQSGQSFSPGTTLGIQWTASDNVGIASQDILLSTDGGFNFNTSIVGGLPGDQRFYNWSIPSNLASSSAQLRIIARDFSGLSGSGQTGSFFIRDATPPSISMVAPLGGETISPSSTFLIRWNSFDNIGIVSHDIQFSSNGGASFSTIGSTGSQQNFSWNVPNISTSQGRIRVIARDGANNSNQDTSGNFTIRDNTPPSVSIIAPSGGEQLTPGQSFLIRWNASDNIGVVSQDVLFSSNGGSSFGSIQTSLGSNQNQFNWTVPSGPASQARIRVVARDASGLVGQADSNFFSIIGDNRSPTVDIEAPESGDAVPAGSNFLIRWSSSDNIGVVSHEILFSSNGGSNFSTIGNTGGSARSFNWSVPNITTNNARIRVIARDAAGNEGRDTTGNFRITDTTPPFVSLQRPSTGESLVGQSTYTIRWSASDNFGVVSQDLLYSTNGGSTFTTIQTGLAGSQTQFNWTVPSINTSQARVRVIARDSNNNSGQDTSGNFSITTPNRPPAVRVIAPNGGEVLIGGRDFLIQWITSDATVVSQDILLSTDGGSSFSTIRSGLSGSASSFNWTVSSTSTNRGRIRVVARDASGNAGSDDSDANFIIQSGGGGGGLNAFVAAGSLTIVNGLPNSPSLGGSVGTQGGTRGVVVSPNGQYALAWAQSNTVQIVSGLGGSSPFISGSFSAGGIPQAVVIGPDSTYAVVANLVGSQTTISIVSGLPSSPSVSTPSTVQFSSTARDMAISPNGNAVVLSLPSLGAVAVVQNLRPGPPVGRTMARVGADPAGVAIGQDNDTIYVAASGINNVVILKGLLSPTGPGIVSAANTGQGSRPTGLRLSPDGGTLVVSNSGNSTATIYRVSGESLIERGVVSTGSNPVGVAIARDGQSAIISNTGDRTLSVIIGLSSGPSAGPRLGPSNSLSTQPDALQSVTYFP